MNSTNTDTQLPQEALLLKGALAAHLSKTGHSLQDLEDALARNDKEKVAELTKGALDLGGALSGTKDFFQGVAQLGLGGSMLYGGVGGLGLYGAYKGLKDSNKKLEEGDAVKQRIDLARRELETELAAQQQHR